MGGSASKDKPLVDLTADDDELKSEESKQEPEIFTKDYTSWGPRFTEPNVPVIFVLGGPGSGKITHCNQIVADRQGIAHINMLDIIQQYLAENNFDDFNRMPPEHLIETLQAEINKSPTAIAYLISGYPRSLLDVTEYSEKLKRVDRAILLNWRMYILERQVEQGASQLGFKVHQMAKMELRNYSLYGLSVSEHFYGLNKLDVVDGKRSPDEVYADLLAAVDLVLRRAARRSEIQIEKQKRNSWTRRIFRNLRDTNLRLIMWAICVILFMGYFYHR